MTTDPLLERVGHLLVEQDRDPRLPWHSSPGDFARECIEWAEGTELAPYQAEVLDAIPIDRRVAVRGPHGLGKSAIAALAILWFAVTRDAAGTDWRVLMTAGAWRQLEHVLLPEIRRWSNRLRWDLIGREPFDRNEFQALSLRLAHGRAIAAASDNPALLEGQHADSVMVVLDEAKAIDVDVFEAVEGALSGTGEAFALALSTPGVPSGAFYDICTHQVPGWHPFHVTIEEAVAAGRVSQRWCKDRALQWGETSAVFANRVKGEFADSETDGVIPLAWVEAAIERWRIWDEAGRPTSSPPVLGVDVGRGGDKSVIAKLRGWVVELLERHTVADVMALTGHVVKHASEPGATTIVDVIGIGSGPVDRLRELHISVEAFNASARSDRRDRAGSLGFVNRRAEAWWTLREALDPAFEPTLALPDDDELVGDLTAPRWTVNSSGRIQIESKDEVRKRLKRSPDAGDATVLACTRHYNSRPTAPGAAGPFRWRQGGSLFQPDRSWGGSLFADPTAAEVPYYDDPSWIDGPELPRHRPWR